MSVWYVIPSKRKAEEAEAVLYKWLERGYKVLVQRDPHDPMSIAHIQREYRGYAEAVNHLIRKVLEWDAAGTLEDHPEWFVTGGDDVWPEPSKTAAEIAQECSEHFGTHKRFEDETSYVWLTIWGTFGVMQPTGDRWGAHPDAHEFYPAQTGNCFRCGRGKECDQHLQGAYIDRVAGSPWIGREFARRMYGGRGPLCEEYFHMGEDEELQAVATKMGVFWQRPDLTHYHAHWGRPKPGKKYGRAEDMPAFLEKASSAEQWKAYREIFERRKAEGWPGSEPIP